jgi:hypothetical protein
MYPRAVPRTPKPQLAPWTAEEMAGLICDLLDDMKATDDLPEPSARCDGRVVTFELRGRPVFSVCVSEVSSTEDALVAIRAANRGRDPAG